MAEKSRLSALLTRDHKRLAEIYLEEGKRAEAVKALAKAGEWKRAGALALELGQAQEAANIFLRGALGAAAEPHLGASPAHAGEVLSSTGHLEEALPLLEIGGSHRAAAILALRLRQPARAAVLFERAREFEQAAAYYEETGRLQDALRVLNQHANRLASAQPGPRARNLEEARRAVDQKRSALLARIGKSEEALDLMRGTGMTPKTAKVLEETGRFREAAEAFLVAGSPQDALRLVGKAQGLAPRTLAEIYKQNGHAAPAARLLAQLGDLPAAAAAFEEAGEWEQAGQAWLATREPLKAAGAYLRARRLHEAARCFEQGGDLARAGEAYAAAGDQEAAAKAFLHAGQPMVASTHFLNTGNRSGAAKALQQVAAGDGDFARATLLLVPLLMDEGLLDAALHRVRMLAPPRDGSDTEGLDRLYWEARVLEEQQQGDEALVCFQRLVALRRDHRDAVARAQALAARRGAMGGASIRLPAAGAGTLGGAPATLAQPAAPNPQPAPAIGGPLPAGYLLAGRYEIQGELGRGGMGQVYRAFDRELGEVVAVKTVIQRADAAASDDEERLVRELQICRRITHPNVVRVFDLGRVDGGIFITMELLEGTRLDGLIGRNRQVSLARVKAILAEICAGLEEAHALGIVHRDLKPGNIMVTPKRLKILDFGIARMDGFDTRLTRTGLAVGSPLYMSPEQIQGQPLDGRSDLYSLGVLAFTLIAGREPFVGNNVNMIVLDHLQTAPPDLRSLRAELPPIWQGFVAKLLAKEREDRYASAAEVIAVLPQLPA